MLDMKNNKKTCELATHFNLAEHQLSDISFIAIETITNFRNSSHLESILFSAVARGRAGGGVPPSFSPTNASSSTNCLKSEKNGSLVFDTDFA